jgi:two-component system, OmpR family, sensor histidine kinase MprB
VRRVRDWSVRSRLAAVSTVAVILGLSVAGAVGYVVTDRVLRDQVDDSLRETPINLDRPRPEGTAPPDAASLCQAFSSSDAPSPGLFTVMLIQEDGTVCVDPSVTPVVLEDADFVASRQGDSVRLRDGVFENGDAARVAVSVQDANVLVVARNTESVENVLRTLLVASLGVLVLGALIALALSRWVAGSALKPVTRFAEVAEDIAETGSLDQAVVSEAPVHAGRPGDELGRLARAFNTMTKVLAEAQLRQQRLVADAGHELRTPLTSLGANIALLRRSRSLDRPLPADEEDRLLVDLSDQVHELSRLVDDLAALADSDQVSSVFTEVRLDHCVERALARARTRTDRDRFRSHLVPCVVNGDAAQLERAVLNLLDNAVKFAPGDTRIEVTVAGGLITVSDRGLGVDDEEADRAFERFWRAPGARSLPGSGLGLSIVADAAARHGGWASLAARPGGGTVARLCIPLLGDDPVD